MSLLKPAQPPEIFVLHHATRRHHLSHNEEEQFLPKSLPKPWVHHPLWRPGFYAYRQAKTGMNVIVSVMREEDEQRWLHVSLAYKTRLPSWDDIKMVKSIFIGDNRFAYQVFPPVDQYVNLHPFVLHLWSCVDVEAGAVLPDFRGGGNSI